MYVKNVHQGIGTGAGAGAGAGASAGVVAEKIH